MALSWALGVAESEAQQIAKGRLTIALKEARWRLEPATDKQLRILDMYDVNYDREITKGEACDLINVIFARQKTAVH